MTVTINVFVALVIALGLSLGLFLVSGQREASAARALESAESALASVPSPQSREDAAARAASWEQVLAPLGRFVLKGPGRIEKSLVRATALRMALAQRLLPITIFIMVLGFFSGLLRRDWARNAVVYSSATFSYLGKCLALASLAFAVFVALSPFAPALWTLYPAIGAAALGTTIYVGNLPPRL